MKIGILSDGKPGHLNQSIGVVNILSEDLEFSFTIIHLSMKYSSLQALSRIYQRFLCRNFNKINAGKIINLFHPIYVDDLDLLIATGGNTAYISASLGKNNNIKVIQIGSVKGIDLKNYSAHITIEAKDKSPNNIVTTLAPTRYSPIETLNGEKQNKALFLIGGDGSGYKYNLDDWSELVRNIKKLKDESNVSPIIVTSRRTSKAHEEFLYEQTLTFSSPASIWFHKDGINADLSALFNQVDSIFVTEESSMMINEAISSGLPVCTLYPKVIKSPKSFSDQISKLRNMNFISSLPFKSELTHNTLNNNLKIIEIRESLKKNIINRIK
tara:strand:+ start:1119 stop:2099 length:981 start_codon:yes stop_codon:yes gene_type:complete